MNITPIPKHIKIVNSHNNAQAAAKIKEASKRFMKKNSEAYKKLADK
jgi:hypothetical protein